MKVDLQDIRKSFGENLVLSGINLSIDDGEIIALAGENGAGKSTLMKILSGAERPNGGKILLDGKEVVFHNPMDAMNYGISMIYQEMNLMRDLTVAENLFLVDEQHQYGSFFTNKRKMVTDAQKFLSRMGLSIDPMKTVSHLSVAEQQLVEISKSLVKNAKLLIMDEPTAALNKEETGRLFEQVRNLKKHGITVIYITHRMEEIAMLADRVAVLRDGQVVLLKHSNEVNQNEIVTAMVGKQIENFYPKEHNAKMDEVEFSVSHLSCKPYFSEMSFELHKGEVLGIAGLMGSGKSEVLRALFGVMPGSKGQIQMEGKPAFVRKPADAIHHGIGYLTADRKLEGLMMDLSICHNLSIVSLKKFVGALDYVNSSKERAETGKFMKQVNIKARDLDVYLHSLSGGNQQKVVFGKWMMTQPKVFMMDEPTRGVDVKAKTEIYGIINDLTRRGISILLVTSDIPELVAMADRVLVMRNGEFTKELNGDEIDQHHVLNYCMRGDSVVEH